MDRFEFSKLHKSSKESIARSHLSIAALGDAERCADAFSACPWLIESSHVTAGLGGAAPSMIAHLCFFGGAEACRRFGELIRPQQCPADEFAALTEAAFDSCLIPMMQFEHGGFPALTQMAMLRGMDANPNLPKGLGSRLHCGFLERKGASTRLLKGARSAADAIWWSRAISLHGKKLGAGSSMDMRAIQVGETFGLLLEEAQWDASMPLGDLDALGHRMGDAMAAFSVEWPTGAEGKAALVAEGTDWTTGIRGTRLNNFRCGRGNACFRGGIDGNAERAIRAALSRLDEPLLSTMAMIAMDGFAAAIESRRIELASMASQSLSSVPTLRI